MGSPSDDRRNRLAVAVPSTSIRDTANVLGPAIELEYVEDITLWVRNTLDQQLNIIHEIQFDGVNWIQFGLAQNITAGGGWNSFTIANSKYPWGARIRCRLNAAVTPTTGIAEAWWTIKGKGA